MSSTEEGFSFGSEVTTVVVVDSVSLDKESGPSVGQAFFEGEMSIAMDLGKRLCYFSQNPTLKLETISSSSS